MIKSALTGDFKDSPQPIPSLPRDERLDLRPRGAHSPLELDVRRLHYFIDLLEAGFRQALQPDPLPHSLRGERIALGIDVPELDTVPLWSIRRTDGAVAIPFVEYIVAEICRILVRIGDESSLSGAAGEDLTLARGRLERLLDQTIGGAAAGRDLPRLGDVFLPTGLLDEVCGRNGLLASVAGECEALLSVGSAPPGH